MTRSGGPATVDIAEARLGPVLMRSSVPMALARPDGSYLDVNDALCTLLGFERGELLRLGWRRITPPEDLPRDDALVGEMVAGATDRIREVKQLLRADGGVLAVDLSVMAIREGPGAPYNLVQIVDVGAREAALAELAVTSERYRLVVEGTGDIVFRGDADGRLDYVSPSVREVLGYGEEDLLGRTGLELVHPDDRPLVAAGAEAIRRGGRASFQARYETAGGEWRWLWVVAGPIHDAGGRVVGRSGVLRDVDAAFRARAVAERAHADLEEAQRVGRIGSFSWEPGSDARAWSDEMYRLYGREPGSAVPTRDETAAQMHPEEFARLNAAVADALRTGEPYAVEYDLQGLDGVERRVLARGEVEVGPAGAIALVRGTVADVSELAAARTALAASEARYRLLVESTGDVVFRSSPDAVIEWISAPVERMLGWSPADLVGTPTIELVHPDDRPTLRQAFATVDREGPVSYEARFRHADGSLRWCWVIAAPILDETGTVIGRTGVVRDVEDQFRQRRALEDAERELHAAQRVAHVGSWWVDPVEGTANWSDELYGIHGLEPGPAVFALDEIERVLPRGVARIFAELIERAGAATGEDHPYVFTWPDASTRHLLASSEAVRDGSGTIVGLRGTVADVTQQHERRQARTRRLAARADYLDRAEHTLRTHLTVVEGWLEAIDGAGGAMDPERLQRGATAISRNVRSLSRLLRDLMTEAGVAARAEAVEPEPVDVAAVATRVAGEFEGMAEVGALRVEPASGIVALATDEGLATVVQHLVDNAVKFSGPAGTVVLEVRRHHGAVELSVTDDGPGIDPAVHPFEAFSKGGAAAGHGLGLHVVRTIVESFGGSVRAEAGPDGRGARFVVRLRSASRD